LGDATISNAILSIAVRQGGDLAHKEGNRVGSFLRALPRAAPMV
jgi:hypothetical protein